MTDEPPGPPGDRAPGAPPPAMPGPAGPGQQRFVVYFTKGLADVVTGELAELAPETAADQAAERFAIVTAGEPDLARLLAAGRTFDDLRLLAAGPAAIPDAESFGRLCASAAAVTRAYLAARDPAWAGSSPWSVTMSARRPGWRAQGWDPAAAVVARLNGADLHGTVRHDVDLRVQVDGEQAHISVSLTARPHGKREAAPARPGALRPSVAAALVRLAVQAAEPGAVGRGVYDPCCGTGTIAAEAARLSVPVYASDIDPEAVSLTTARLSGLARQLRAPRPPRVFQHDVLRVVPRDVQAAIVVSNLPWGKQIQLPREGELFDAVAALVARGLTAGGTCALLTTSGDRLAARIRRRAPGAVISARRIGLLGQTPAIVTASPPASQR